MTLQIEPTVNGVTFDHIRFMYEMGDSISVIASLVGCTQKTIKNIIKKA